MELKNSQTLKNLTRAFASECSDGAKYQYMADEATTQKLSNVSTCLKALDTNEMAHAKIFYDYIAQNVDVEDLNVEINASYPMSHAPLVEMLNIKSKNEEFQAQTVYPSFAKTAKKEGFEDISQKFMIIADIEANHEKILHNLYEKLKNNTLLLSNEKELWKCNNCGYEESSKKAWKKCPLCTKDSGFVKLNLNI